MADFVPWLKSFHHTVNLRASSETQSKACSFHPRIHGTEKAKGMEGMWNASNFISLSMILPVSVKGLLMIASIGVTPLSN